jgi:hypothetical protein
VEIASKTKKNERTPIVEGSKFVSQDMAVLPKGTPFAVKILFQYSARRNFLKSDTVELPSLSMSFNVSLKRTQISHFFIMEAAKQRLLKHASANC